MKVIDDPQAPAAQLRRRQCRDRGNDRGTLAPDGSQGYTEVPGIVRWPRPCGSENTQRARSETPLLRRCSQIAFHVPSTTQLELACLRYSRTIANKWSDSAPEKSAALHRRVPVQVFETNA